MDELITVIGFEVDDDDAKRFNVTLDKVKRGAIAVGAAVTGAVTAIGAFTKKISAELDETGKFANSIGVNVEQLQGLEFAMERAGGTASDLRGDLAGLTKSLASPIPGEFNQALQFVFGINPFDEMTGGLKEADKVLLEVADKLEGLSPQKAQIMASQLGLSEGTIRLLVQGRSEINKLVDEAGSLGGIIPESATINAALLQDQITNLNTAFKGISNTIAASLFPGMTKTLTKFTEWIKVNKTIISQNIGEVVRGITSGFDDFINIIQVGLQYVGQFIPVLDSMTGKFELFETVSSAVTAALLVATVALSPLIIKFGLIAAAITGVIVVIKDMVSWFKGGESVIGDFVDQFLEKFPGAAKSLQNIRDNIAQVVEKIQGFLSSDAGGEFIAFFAALPKIAGEALEGVLNIFIQYIDLITSLFTGDSSKIVAAFKGLGNTLVESVTGAFSTIADSAKKFLPDWMLSDSAMVSSAQGVSSLASSAMPRASSVTNNSNAGGPITIQVDGSKSPTQTAQVIKKTLQNPMARTMQTGSAGTIR